MSFQEKWLDTTAQLRERANGLACVALATARSGVAMAADRAEAVKVAAQELNKVASRHASRFVKENRSLASAAGKDLRALARVTFAAFAGEPVVASKPRRKSARAKRTHKKAG